MKFVSRLATGLALVMTVPSSAQSDPKLESIVTALNRLKVTGYLQAQYVHDESSENVLGGNRDQFSVRRARVKFTYQATRTSRFVLEPDAASGGVTLKDGYAEMTEPWTSWKHTLTAGQFKWPFGIELAQSSSRREVPERSRVTRTLFPGERDRGVMLSGRGLGEKLEYRLAVVNGTGTTRSDDLNKRKDVVGRLGYSLGTVSVGASVYRGSELIATAANASGAEFDKRRQGVDLVWQTPAPGLTLRAEYVTGKQAPASGTSRRESFDVEGWYAYAVQRLGKRQQVALRVDQYDGNTRADADAVRTVTAAYTFLWDEHSKVMVAYEAPRRERNDPDDNLFTLRYQFSF